MNGMYHVPGMSVMVFTTDFESKKSLKKPLKKNRQYNDQR